MRWIIRGPEGIANVTGQYSRAIWEDPANVSAHRVVLTTITAALCGLTDRYRFRNDVGPKCPVRVTPYSPATATILSTGFSRPVLKQWRRVARAVPTPRRAPHQLLRSFPAPLERPVDNRGALREFGREIQRRRPDPDTTEIQPVRIPTSLDRHVPGRAATRVPTAGSDE